MKLNPLAYAIAIVFGQNPYCPTLPIFPQLRFYTAQEQEENYVRLMADTYGIAIGANNG